MGDSSFAEAAKEYATRVVALADTLPLLVAGVGTGTSIAQTELQKTVEKYGVAQDGDSGENGPRYRIPVEHLEKYRRDMRLFTKLNVATEVLGQSLVTSLVAQFDVFVGNVLRAMFAARPALLNDSDRAVTYSALVDFGSVDRAVEYLIEKEVEAVLRRNHVEQFDYISKKLGNVPLTKDLKSWPTFIEVTERRNLYVHADGRVSSQYLEVCRKHGVTGLQGVVKGQHLLVTPQYFRDAYQSLLEIGLKLSQVVWRKLEPSDREEQDESVVPLAYDLLQEQEYVVAQRVLEFARDKLINRSNTETQMICVVNLAQAYKWNGDEDRCRELVEAQDWSALEERFQLARAVLRDDFEGAGRLMRRTAGTSDDRIGRPAYESWPLFQKFRESSAFLDAFEAAYGEAFEVVTPAQPKPLQQLLGEIKPPSPTTEDTKTGGLTHTEQAQEPPEGPDDETNPRE